MFELPTKSFKITVGDDEYRVAPSDFFIEGRTDEDRHKGAGKLFFFLTLKARCERAERLARRNETRWESAEITKLLAADAKVKVPEWKAKATIAQSEEKKAHTRAVSDATYNVGLATAAVISMQAKIELLRTKSADERKERDTAGDVDYIADREEHKRRNRDKVKCAGRGRQGRCRLISTR